MINDFCKDEDQRHPHVLNELNLDGVIEYIKQGREYIQNFSDYVINSWNILRIRSWDSTYRVAISDNFFTSHWINPICGYSHTHLCSYLND